jgi:hypothetical protein
MWFISSRRPRKTKRKTVRPQRSFRPRLEQLEDRTTPSSFSAGTVADLIADINAANLAGGSNGSRWQPARPSS